MTTTNATSSGAYSETTLPSEWDELPVVQYGFPKGKGPKRSPKLKTIFEPVPDGAITASPVYGLTRDQYERQADFESGYEVKGVTSIATELQDEAEADDRVLYPIHVESDELLTEGPETLTEWCCEFVEDELDIPFNTCLRYYSGNQSIHVHVPRFVSGDAQREQLKERAETFCEETGAELDCGIYSRKRLFRLPGVEHEKTGLPKVEIDGEWDDARVHEKVQNPAQVPESYEAVLRHVFVRDGLTVDSAQPTAYSPHDLFRVLDSDKTVLTFGSNEREIQTPLVEQIPYPDDPAEVPKWAQYNGKEFSPYALAEGNDRSVAVVTVKGGAFAREDVRNGTALVPAYFYGARGCAGEEFTMADRHAPLQLSKPDYAKWDYETGDHVVIIGGQSRNSRIFRVKSWQARAVAHNLTGEGAGRQAALDYLEDDDYDIGTAGSSHSTSSEAAKSHGQSTADHIWPAREKSQSETEELQRRAEQEGIETLSHTERGRIACRVLRYGWDPAWEWFKQQFGADFKPEVTWVQFRSIIEAYKDYDHVEVPDKPV